MTTILSRMANAVRRAAPDTADVFFVGGLGLMGYGLWQVYAPAAFILPGAVLVAAALRGR